MVKKTWLFTSISVLAMNLAFAQTPTKNKAEQILSQMSLKEKIDLLIGNHLVDPQTFGKPNAPTVGSTQDRVPGAAGATKEFNKFNLPSIILSDGPAGIRIDPVRNNDSSRFYYATAFPVGSLLAATWDTSLVYKVGEAIGNEALEYDVDVFLGPAMNIQRNPLGGRNFEYYSEDPVVSGDIAASMVNGIQSKNVAATIKHFIANNQETGRSYIDEKISQRALREIYLKGFQIAVEKSHPWAVMSSYNKVNGLYTSENKELLETILRNEWKYDGVVMTDWFGGIDPAKQIDAGNDLLMPGYPRQAEQLMTAVKNNTLSKAAIDRDAERVLNLIMKTPAYNHYKYSDKPDLKNNAVVARTAAAEGMVLLKNENNILPLTNHQQNIALFGNHSYDLITGGMGSGDVNKAYAIAVSQGLTNANYKLNDDLNLTYSNYLTKEKAKIPQRDMLSRMITPDTAIHEPSLEESQIEDAATNSDIAIITIGKIGGEFHDHELENDFNLRQDEIQMLEKVSKAFHSKNKKVIVLLNIGTPIDMENWPKLADAILLMWQPGQEGGNAVADIISSNTNPSGKLPITFTTKYSDVPNAVDFPEVDSAASKGLIVMAKKPVIDYKDDIYVGYRYYNTHKVKTAYEFGYGLSYTTFAYSKLSLDNAIMKDKITATVTVTNSGNTAGKEIVELYISAPAKTMDKPSEELKAFAKTRMLQPGESQQISFTVSPELLASYDSKKSSWIAEKGNYTLKVGSSSLNILQQVNFNLPTEIVTEKCFDVLKP